MGRDSYQKITPNFGEFEELFRKNHKFLCLIAFNYVNDKYLAEDIVQDFFISFWQKQDTIVLKGSFEAYARQAVKYRSIDYIRKQEVNIRRMSELPSEPEGYELDEDMEKLSMEQERHLRILELIEKLPEDRRRIFILHAMEELNHPQIAKKLNISVNTVKTQLYRAYKALRSKAILLISLF